MSENIEEQEFKKGFNRGYLLRTHRPDIKMPDKLNGTSIYADGFLSGIKQVEMEQKREQIRKGFGLDNSNGKDRSAQRER